MDKEGNDITTYPYDDGDVMFHKLIDGVKASEVAAESFPLEIKQGEILSLDTYFNAFPLENGRNTPSCRIWHWRS